MIDGHTLIAAGVVIGFIALIDLLVVCLFGRVK